MSSIRTTFAGAAAAVGASAALLLGGMTPVANADPAPPPLPIDALQAPGLSAVQSIGPAIQQAAADPTNAASTLMAAAAVFAGDSAAPTGFEERGDGGEPVRRARSRARRGAGCGGASACGRRPGARRGTRAGGRAGGRPGSGGGTCCPLRRWHPLPRPHPLRRPPRRCARSPGDPAPARARPPRRRRPRSVRTPRRRRTSCTRRSATGA